MAKEETDHEQIIEFVGAGLEVGRRLTFLGEKRPRGDQASDPLAPGRGPTTALVSALLR